METSLKESHNLIHTYAPSPDKEFVNLNNLYLITKMTGVSQMLYCKYILNIESEIFPINLSSPMVSTHFALENHEELFITTQDNNMTYIHFKEGSITEQTVIPISAILMLKDGDPKIRLRFNYQNPDNILIFTNHKIYSCDKKRISSGKTIDCGPNVTLINVSCFPKTKDKLLISYIESRWPAIIDENSHNPESKITEVKIKIGYDYFIYGDANINCGIICESHSLKKINVIDGNLQKCKVFDIMDTDSKSIVCFHYDSKTCFVAENEHKKIVQIKTDGQLEKIKLITYGRGPIVILGLAVIENNHDFVTLLYCDKTALFEWKIPKNQNIPNAVKESVKQSSTNKKKSKKKAKKQTKKEVKKIKQPQQSKIEIIPITKPQENITTNFQTNLQTYANDKIFYSTIQQEYSKFLDRKTKSIFSQLQSNFNNLKNIKLTKNFTQYENATKKFPKLQDAINNNFSRLQNSSNLWFNFINNSKNNFSHTFY